jgi:hypothetical protein
VLILFDHMKLECASEISQANAEFLTYVFLAYASARRRDFLMRSLPYYADLSRNTRYSLKEDRMATEPIEQ